MKFNSDEIASVIQKEIEQFESQIDVREVGTVLKWVTGSLVYMGFRASCRVKWSSSPAA